MAKFLQKDRLATCFPAKCPHCEEVHDFCLYAHQQGNWVLMFMPIPFFGKSHVVACSNCGYEIVVSNKEAPAYYQIANDYLKVRKGELSYSVFEQLLAKSELRVYKELLETYDVWDCPKCGTQNPHSFETCYTCGFVTDRDGGHGEEDWLPDVEGRDPWEK